jgi:hypothetical protein
VAVTVVLLSGVFWILAVAVGGVPVTVFSGVLVTVNTGASVLVAPAGACVGFGCGLFGTAVGGGVATALPTVAVIGCAVWVSAASAVAAMSVGTCAVIVAICAVATSVASRSWLLKLLPQALMPSATTPMMNIFVA